MLERQARDGRQAFLDVADVREQLLRGRRANQQPSSQKWKQAFHATMNLYGRRQTVFRRSAWQRDFHYQQAQAEAPEAPSIAAEEAAAWRAEVVRVACRRSEDEAQPAAQGAWRLYQR